MIKGSSPQVKQTILDDLEKNERERKAFARRLLRKRRTYDSYFAAGLKEVDVALRRVQANRAYCVEQCVTGESWNPSVKTNMRYRVCLIDRIKTKELGRKEKVALQKYAAKVRERKIGLVKRLHQKLAKKKEHALLLAKEREERKRKEDEEGQKKVDSLIRRGRLRRQELGIPDRPDGHLDLRGREIPGPRPAAGRGKYSFAPPPSW
jgi:hypothetical protein